MTSHRKIVDKAVKIIGPTNKQEMAEWLAENVLADSIKTLEAIVKAGYGELKYVDAIEKFIYSPDGFFAVWDVLEKKDFNYVSILRGNKKYNCFVSHADMKPEYYGKGKDRYESFYNAVYEAMK